MTVTLRVQFRRIDMTRSLLLGMLLLTPARLAAQLSVYHHGGWVVWYRSDQAPRSWSAPDTMVTAAIHWNSIRPGLRFGELRLAGTGTAWRLKAVVLNLEPRRFSFHLVRPAQGSEWSVSDAPDHAAFALNAGQFTDAGSWGWLILDRAEVQRPGYGPLSTAVLFGSDHTVSLVEHDDIGSLKASHDYRYAFQSYPTLLSGDGDVPPQLLASARGVDLEHRDSRLAMCTTRDDHVLIVLTRFDALAGALESAPFGPTVPEMAALMGALGCNRAVMLDGGISGQLLLQHSGGRREIWKGWRNVPLGLVAIPR